MVSVLVVCFFGVVLPMSLLLLFGFSLPKMSRKISLDVRSGVSGFSPLFLWFFSPTSSPFLFLFPFFFLREIAQVVTGHTPTRTLCSCFLFLILSPPQPGLSPCLAVRPFFLAFCQGAILGPRAFWRLLGFSRYCGGLEITRPLLRLFSRTRGGKGASLLLVPVFVFPFS